MISASNLKKFFFNAAQADPDSRIVLLIDNAGAHLSNEDRESVYLAITSLMSNPHQSFDASNTPFSRSSYEILCGSFAKEGYWANGFRRVSEYLGLTERFTAGSLNGRMLFIESLILLFSSQMNIMIMFELIAQDHPEMIFKDLARSAIKTVTTGQSLVPLFSQNESLLGREFVEAWAVGEAQGEFEKSLQTLVFR